MDCFERYHAILAHEKPDKLPFYFPTVACTVAGEILGRPVDSGADSLHFKEELALLRGPAAHEEFSHRYQEDAIALNRALRADIVRETWRSSAKPTKQLDEYTLLFGQEDGAHLVKRFYPQTQTYGVILDKTPSLDLDALKTRYIKEMSAPIQISEDKLEAHYASQLAFKKRADPYFPTIAGGLGIPVMMTNVAWLEATLLETELLRDYYLYKAQAGLPHIAWLAKKGFRFLNGGGDIASNTAPMLSPRTFRAIFTEPLTLIARECAKHGMAYCYRTDGNIWAIMDAMFADTGVQAYGEVDREASMSVGAIRERYPNLIILGNIASNTLCCGTEQQVREETRAGLTESGGTHYIPGPSNAVVHGTPPENLYAMIEEIEGYVPG